MNDTWCPCGACNDEGPELPEYEPKMCRCVWCEWLNGGPNDLDELDQDEVPCSTFCSACTEEDEE